MSIYNDKTKVEVQASHVEKTSIGQKWLVRTVQPVAIGDRYLPAMSAFVFVATDDDTKEDVESYVESRGILNACNISDAEFERLLEEY